MVLLTLASSFVACSTLQSASTERVETNSKSISLSEYIALWSSEGKPTTIDDTRAESFTELVKWIEEQDASNVINLNFICTHNSRRSHMSQLWAQAAAYHFGHNNIKTYSGGTKATAFNPRAVLALQQHGFQIEESGEVLEEKNIIYTTSFADHPSIQSFSKKYNDSYNPQSQFAAIMVCSNADKSCPLVTGADFRLAIPYVDPKVSDNTPKEEATYFAKSEEIGKEMVWLMSQISD